MLSLSNVTSSMAVSYFSQDDYYTHDGKEIPVFGRGTQALNLKNQLDRNSFQNLLEGLSPDGSRFIVPEKVGEIEKAQVHDALSQFKNALSQNELKDHQIQYLLKEITGHLPGLLNGADLQKGLSIRHRRDLNARIHISIKKWGIEGKSSRKVMKATEKLWKVLSPETRRAGTDLTFSAPKSVSLLGLIGKQPEIIECHSKAVDYALKHVEDHLIGSRVTKNHQTLFQPTKNMVGAKFLHATSREGDPQLHTHCVLFNLTKRPDGRWASVHNDSIFHNSKFLGVLYKNKMAELIQKTGYEIESTGDGSFEIKGYSKSHLQTFSKRRLQVLEAGAKILYEAQKKEQVGAQKSFQEQKLELMKKVTPELSRMGVYRDRKSKGSLSAADFQRKWQKEAVQVKLSHPRKKGPNLWGQEVNINTSLMHLGEKKAVFTARQLELQSLIDNIGKATFEDIQMTIKNDKNSVIIDKKREVVARLEQLREEQKTVKYIKNQRRNFKPLSTLKSLERLKEKRTFTLGQKEALQQALTTHDQFSVWNGVAGSGKTYALKDLAAICEKRGYRPIALAPDGSSARELGQSIKSDAATIHRFLFKNDSIRRAYLIVDESSKISSQLMNKLLEYAKTNKSRVLFVGDQRQFSAIEAGNPFQTICQKVKPAELNEHQRQKNLALKRVVELASYQTVDSIRKSVENLGPSIMERKSELGRQNELIRSYLKLSKEEQMKTLLVVDDNHDRRVITAALRSKLQYQGSLSRKEKEVPTLEQRNLTQQEKLKPQSYKTGDIVIPYGVSSRLQNSKQYTIKSIQPAFLELQGDGKRLKIKYQDLKASIYKVSNLTVAKGDLLQWRKNTPTLKNRDFLHVLKVSKNYIKVQNERKEKFEIRTDQPQPLDYGIIQTTYSSQGATRKNIIAITSSRSSQQSWYVTLSRAQENVKIITDSKENLLKSILKSKKQENALDRAQKQDVLDHVKRHKSEKKMSLSFENIKIFWKERLSRQIV